MTDPLRNEQAALERYFMKHFIANPRVDTEWFMRERDSLNETLRHDPEIDTHAQWQKRKQRFSQYFLPPHPH